VRLLDKLVLREVRQHAMQGFVNPREAVQQNIISYHGNPVFPWI
jgi:hypothetical protein